MSDAFWDFSLAFYAVPGVEQSCLELQDRHGADVNLVLFALWAAASGCLLDAAMIGAAERIARPWRERVTEPIRAVRRALKEPPDGFDGAAVAALRRQVQSLEIEAERLQQLAMARALPAGGSSVPAAVAHSNLALYETMLGRPFGRAPLQALLQAFIGQLAEHGGGKP